VLQVARPVGTGIAGGHEQRAVRRLDEPDRDADRSPGRPTARLDDDDLAPARELLADRVEGVPPPVLGSVRQRPFSCQDLPSVTTDGA
jgi:hypothetical protein